MGGLSHTPPWYHVTASGILFCLQMAHMRFCKIQEILGLKTGYSIGIFMLKVGNPKAATNRIFLYVLEGNITSSRIEMCAV
jgi:hypothetical protein